jgi:hypothetical protein
MFLQSDSIMNGVGSLFLNHHLFWYRSKS